MGNIQTYIRENIGGVLLSAFLGFTAYFLAPYLPGMNGVLLGLIMGIAISNFIKLPQVLNKGISTCSGKLLEFSIIFLAFSINFGQISAIGFQSFVAVAIAMIIILLLTIVLSKKLNCPGSTGWLVGFGTAICGSSAIAAAAPSVSINREDIGVSVAVVNLIGGLGMLFLPFLFIIVPLCDAAQGILIGGTLHSVGNVAGAGYGISKSVGEIAITIKLVRVALLSPALNFFNFMINRKEVSSWKQHFQLPYYLWLFMGVTIWVSLLEVSPVFVKLMDTIGKMALTVAMTAIGLKIGFKNLYKSGKIAIGFGVILFGVLVFIYILLLQIIA